ncbi:hypothetical protein BJ138DRAFT_305952 [Hygrophoropsis aurantiaca]|uniref:Uncharacterized protein n=1 Tax=Hygrophoropsis aurantiaca TaxID=72124 RepID=A0ACB8A790_9AGAM|nr:hypothetical protein BJ138DRAFT_305952 [Hygrophoropsis aurantiaca]
MGIKPRMQHTSNELEPGLYMITSLCLPGGSFIGRDVHEDLSLRPKRVIVLPQGVQAPRWIVESLGKGRYRLKVGGAPTCEMDKELYAMLVGTEGEEWIIKHRDYHDACTIEKADEKAGWVVPGEKPQTQIAVRPLMSQPSAPPKFPDNELFKFIRIDRD